MTFSANGVNFTLNFRVVFPLQLNPVKIDKILHLLK